MSLLAFKRTFSPEPTPTTYYDDEQFDKDFLKYIHSSPPPFEFDYLSPKIVTDEMSHHHLDNGLGIGIEGQDQGIKSDTSNEKVIEVDTGEDVDVSMTTLLDPTNANTTSPFRMQNLQIDENSSLPHSHTHQQMNHQGMAHSVDLFGQVLYQPYPISGSYPQATTPLHPYHFHPYGNPRDYSNAMRARSPVSPIRPLSPPLSASPHGSVSSHQSPHLVSPLNSIHPLETSPGGLGFQYQLPFTNLSMSSVNSSAAGAGLGMVQGFPYPTTSVPIQNTGGRVGRPRISRGPTARSKRSSVGVAGGDGGEDDDSDFDDEGHRGGPSTGLGFSPTIQEGDDRIPISNKREDIRKARIESEQRRRDELREGFRRLKEVLPQSTQRSSKSSLLDRSVAHIQSIEAANRYLLQQYETANRELEKLRQTNTELVHAVASNSRGSNSPHGHGNGNVSSNSTAQRQ